MCRAGPFPTGTIVDVVEALVEQPAVKLMLRHDRFTSDALLSVAREVAGHLAEFSHSNSKTACSRSAPPA